MAGWVGGKWRRQVDEGQVVAAIQQAEARTSGQIRVSVAPFFWGDVPRAARKAFTRLGMDQTRDRNGVLIFVVPSRKRFAVLGDQGIHEQVADTFWEQVATAMASHFRQGGFTEGLVEGIQVVGDRLAEHFPHEDSAANELPDAIDYGGA